MSQAPQLNVCVARRKSELMHDVVRRLLLFCVVMVQKSSDATLHFMSLLKFERSVCAVLLVCNNNSPSYLIFLSQTRLLVANEGTRMVRGAKHYKCSVSKFIAKRGLAENGCILDDPRM